MNWLSDPSWNGVGAIAAVLSLLLSIFSVVVPLRKRSRRSRSGGDRNLEVVPASPIFPVPAPAARLGQRPAGATLLEDVKLFASYSSFVGGLVCLILLAQTFLGEGAFLLGRSILSFVLWGAISIPLCVLLVFILSIFFERDNLSIFPTLLGVGAMYLFALAIVLFWCGLLGLVVLPIRGTIDSDLQYWLQSWRGRG